MAEGVGEGDVERGKDHHKNMVKRYDKEVEASSNSDAESGCDR